MHKESILGTLAFDTFLCLQGLGPTYLQDLIQRFNLARNLCSKYKFLLLCPPTVTKSYGAQS